MTQNLKDNGDIKILLVEDNNVNQELAVQMLETLGYSVNAVNNGEQALKELAANTYHMVLMDCEMPVMNGYEATRLWREVERQQQCRPIPVIALTAHTASGDREKCLDCGMNDFLSKPFDYAVFSEKICNWLSDEDGVVSSLENTSHEKKIVQDKGKKPVQVQQDDNSILPLLDQEKLNQLCYWQGKHNSELLKKIVSLFLQQLPKLLNGMLEAVQQEDVVVISDIAHTLKSSSATVGAVSLSSLCKQIELHCDSGKIDIDLIDQVRCLRSELELALQQELDKPV